MARNLELAGTVIMTGGFVSLAVSMVCFGKAIGDLENALKQLAGVQVDLGRVSLDLLTLLMNVLLDGDVKVTKYDKFWGQGSIPLGPTSVSESVTPLGDLEFVLDVLKKSKNT